MEETESGHPKGWKKGSYGWLDVLNATGHSRTLSRIVPAMQWRASQEAPHGGNRSMHLAIARSKVYPPESAQQEICANYEQSCLLPASEAPRNYVLLFHYRGHTAWDVPWCRAYVRVSFYDDKGKESRVYNQTMCLPTSRWQKRWLEFEAPSSTRRLDVRLALTGCGEVWFDDVTLYPAVKKNKGPEVRLMPWYFLDNLYCLSSADAGVMLFGFRNDGGSKIDRPQLLVQLPEGVTILDMASAAKIIETRTVQTSDGTVQEYRIDIGAWKGRIHDGTFPYPFNTWEGLSLLLTTSRPVGQTRLKASYWLEDGQYHTMPLSFAIQIVPPLPATAAPKTFRSGAHLFLVEGFAKEVGVKAFAARYQKVGFNSVHVCPSALGAEMGRIGIERYNQPLTNGYTMGDPQPGKKPAEAVFRLADGKPLWEAICPTEVYRRGPYFRRAIENGLLRKILVTERHAEQIMANWEPPMYNDRGCFCDRCKEEFKTFSKLPAREIDRAWPKLVTREYRDVWLKFRSWQHGKLLTTLEETVHALGKEAGLDSHFIPEIHFALLTSSWTAEDQNRQYAAVDYLGKLPVLEPWAPYNWPFRTYSGYDFTNGPYDYICGLHLDVYTTARAVREFVDSRLPEGKHPRLIAFPYGTYEDVTQPEALAFEFLTYFLNGYHGAFAYLFPGGYDARYWRAMAVANRQIAQFEPYVIEGRAVKRHRLKCETPMPKPDPRFLGPGFCVSRTLETTNKWKDLPLLLSWEYERGDARLIAVGNFWEQGECFFRVTPEKLDPAKKYVFREPAANRVYADQNGNVALTAAEIGEGILLHAGAMRYAFFVLEPYRKGVDNGAIIRPRQMEAARLERRSAIDRAYRDDGGFVDTEPKND